MIRVAISGSHSTGKSTLLKALAEKLAAQGKRVGVGLEPIRAVAKRQRNSSDQRNVYVNLLAEHFRRLNVADLDLALYDRSLFDFRTYLKLDAPGETALIELTDELLPRYAAEFDLFLYMPLEIPLTPDGHRPTDEGYRRKVDAELRSLMAKAGVQIVEISGDVDARVAQALKAIDRIVSK
jgi:nicotinamide riboside kinase